MITQIIEKFRSWRRERDRKNTYKYLSKNGFYTGSYEDYCNRYQLRIAYKWIEP